MKVSVDLSPPDLAIVARILAEHVPACEVRAFGSRATWNAKDYSDLDLAVIGEGPLPRGALARLKEAFEESRLPMRVDVVDWHSIADGFRESIESDCVLVQEGTLPRVKDEWREMNLGEVVELKRGYDLPKRDRTSGLIPLVSSSGITDHHAEAKVKGPGVVTGRYGTLGEVFFIPGDFWPLNTTLYVRDFKGNDPRFISYFLRTLDFFAYSDKAAVPGVNRNHLHEEIVRVPPLDEQRSIARVLGALDDRIAINRRMSETLEEMARALFRSWFVDFDPVRAKAEGQPSGLPPDLDALFPESFEASELGEVPAGWEVLHAGRAVTVHGGSTPSTKESAYWGGKHCFATPKDLSILQEPILASTARRLTDAGIARIRSGLLPPGTVLLSSRAPIGYLAVTETPVTINQGIVAMVCDGPVGASYALHWSRSNMDAIEARASGTTFPEISKSSFRELPFLVPTVSIHAAWDSLVAPLYDLVASNARQSRSLAAQRDALLPRLVSGESRVGTRS